MAIKMLSNFVLICFLVLLSVHDAILELEIQCQYKLTRTGSYICKVEQLNDTADYETITKANGKHNLGKTNDNVTAVEGFNLDTTFLPLGFGNVFRGLRALQIMSSNLKHIKRENFADMKNLTLLTLSRNLIEILPEDVFSDLQELEFLILANNRIKVLMENSFSNNKNLKDIYLSDAMLESIKIDLTKMPSFSSIELRRNVCINKVYRLPNFEKGVGDQTLEEFQTFLRKSCP